MNIARLAMWTSPLLVALALNGAPAFAQVVTPPVEKPHAVDLDSLRGLVDDNIPGNSAKSYRELLARGFDAREALRQGLRSKDWQQRLLSALLFVQLDPKDEDLERVCRILIWHLEDNQFRGDSRLAENGIVALGESAAPYLYAAAWGAEGQLAAKCKLLRISTSMRRRDKSNSDGARQALERINLGVAWIGRGRPAVLGLSAPIPTLEQRYQQLLEALANDDRRGNALVGFDTFKVNYVSRLGPSRASDWTPTLKGSPANVALMLPLLWKGLASQDSQQRKLCALLLSERDVAPTALLVEVLIESLAPDKIGVYRKLPMANANLAAKYLIAHIAQASPHLHKVVRTATTPGSNAEVQRIRAAAVLAQGRDSKLAAYVPFLVSRLASNDRSEDAVLCGLSLALLGPAALPWLDIEPRDEQEAHFLSVIRRSIQMLEEDPDARIPFSMSGMYQFER